MSKDDFSNKEWPTPAEAYGTSFPPGEERGTAEAVATAEAAVTAETAETAGDTELTAAEEAALLQEEPEDDILIVDDANYIDWEDLVIPPRIVKREGAEETPVPPHNSEVIRDKRDSICPISTCRVKTRKLKHHCWEFHMPFFFRDKILQEYEDNNEFQQLRGQALTRLAEWILGAGSSVYDLVRHVNDTAGFIPNNCVMMERCQLQMRRLTEVMNWYPPLEGRYGMYPVNSPSVLMQWRLLITLLGELTPARRAEFRRMGSDFTLRPQQPSEVGPQRSYSRNRPVTDAREILNRKRRNGGEGRQEPVKSPKMDEQEGQGLIVAVQQARPCFSVAPSNSGSTPCDLNNNRLLSTRISIRRKAFDSHFHVDRSSTLIRGDLSLTVEDLLAHHSTPAPQVSVEVVGGVAVYCDPDTYPDFILSDPWRTAIGFHPKSAPYFTQEHYDMIRMTFEDPRVAALGEIGLDRTVPARDWTAQEKVFARLLELATPNKPVVVHVRGEKEDKFSTAVYNRALQIMKGKCQREQYIHLHCFHGTETIVESFRKEFPNTFFSFSLKVREFSREQKDAVIVIPAHRLLLETDSPYTTTSSDNRINSPAYLGDVALVVSALRREPVAKVLDDTLQNGKKLYG